LENWDVIEEIVKELEIKHVLGGSEVQQIREQQQKLDQDGRIATMTYCTA